MSGRTSVIAIRIGLLALALSAGALAWAADAGKPQPPAQARNEELGEVLVEGEKEKPKLPSFDDYQSPFNFLSRLVGEFVIEGTVDLHAQGLREDLRRVSGRAECVGFGLAPGVSCELKVRWPETTGPDGEAILGGVSTLNPAVVLYGFDTMTPRLVGLRRPGAPPPATPEGPGVSWVVVDNQGVSETATGYMTSPDTMRSRSKCLTISGNCERMASITAAPNLKTVEMNIDLMIDAQKAVSFAFVMHRVPGTESVVFGRKATKEQKAKAKEQEAQEKAGKKAGSK